ncbi:MAG: bifunctional phosphoribosylaminoimidazolecarboxamide formyltransferase/IMP cyclohydrolase [Thermoanaerobaculia bacterium]
MPPIRRALLSVSDKTGLVELARALTELGVELTSSGGTHRALEDAGLTVEPVSKRTGFPEILGGRVKTLHPRIHGGILADRSQESHRQALAEHGIEPIDLVVVNLYPFRETVARPGTSEAEAVEMIDIGGPAMIRAAAKNFHHVTVVVDPADYPRLLEALASHGGEAPLELRREFAARAFRHTHRYDGAIASWLESRVEGPEPGAELFPRHFELELERVLLPRYGETPTSWRPSMPRPAGRGLRGFRQLHGKELSYNNLLDADAARKLVALFEKPAVAIVKHGNPCGVGQGESLSEAYQRALACDPTSAFGSVIALNRPADEALAAALADLFVEVVIAPGFAPPALERFAGRAALRLLECQGYRLKEREIELRGLDGGFLAQEPDGLEVDPASWQCASRREPTPAEREALLFAWKVARYTKSNAIVVADREGTLGIGAGQMSRVDSCRLAVEKAQRSLAGAVAASDAFFPFRDGLDVLAEAGITAVVQPGGSKRDAEVIAAADERGLALLLTGRRHFRH